MIGIEWVYLSIAGILMPISMFAFEKIIKDSKMKWALLFSILFIVSICFLWLSLEEISAGTAYAIWSAISIIGIVILCVIMGDEQMTIIRIVLVMLLLVGIVGILLTGGM
ncbi:hypothetical protein LJB91_03765 [Bacteroidales bacterium OttesenSCG-928-L03]|nr:hypothetical protein [Bacteroidales bacterium OttesenSCG-928-L03]